MKNNKFASLEHKFIVHVMSVQISYFLVENYLHIFFCDFFCNYIKLLITLVQQ